MVLQSWIIDCLRIYKISCEVIKFIENTKQSWSVELTAGGKNLNFVKIQRRVFQRDALSLLFVRAMMQLNHILMKCTSRYNLHKSQEKISHLICIKLFAKIEKELENPKQVVRINSLDIGMEFG